MKMRIVDGLPFVETKLVHGGKEILLSNVLIDTGSASTIFSADKALELGLDPSLEDSIYTVRGVGGTEFVYEKFIDKVEIGSIEVRKLRIQIGAMDYGFDIDGIIGIDLLMEEKVIIDTGRLELYTDIAM